MKTFTLKTVGLAVALLLLAVLPIAASDQSALGRQVQPGDELAAFFEARGVDPQYLTMPKSAVPAEQWALIRKIVSTPNWDDPDTDYVDYTDDHDVLNSLVYLTLAKATHTTYDPVYITLGGTTWSHELIVEDDE